LVDKTAPQVVFQNADIGLQPASKAPARNSKNAAEESAAKRKRQPCFDFDNDGDLDLAQITDATLRLYRNDKGRFVDATRAAGDLTKPLARAAAVSSRAITTTTLSRICSFSAAGRRRFFATPAKTVS
jgi:hypothetical protein